MNLNKDILRLTLPAILSNLTVPLLGLCDTGIAGHLGDGRLIGAIAIGAMMLNVLFWLCGFLRMGTTGLTAQEFGRGDSSGTRRVFTRSFLLALILGILILIFSVPLGRALLFLIGAEDNVRHFASLYFFICIFGTPAQLMTMAVLGWFLGMQDTVRPMIISIGTNVINIALSFTFVFGAGWGFRGIACGTLAANWCGLILALFLARKFVKDKSLWCSFREIRAGGSLKRFFAVNTDLFFRSACVMGVSLTVTSIGARLGWLTLSTNAVMMQFFILFSYFMDGFAFSGEALCGRFEGAGNRPMLRKSVIYLLGWAAVMAVSFFLIYLFGWQSIVAMLTDDQTVRENVALYRFWLILIPPITVSAFIFDGFFIGLTATRRMLVVTLISASIFFLISFVHPGAEEMTIGLPDNDTLWIAFLSYLFGRGLFLALQTPSLLRRPFNNPLPV